MPELGTIAKGKSLGYATDTLRIYVECPECGNRRWVACVGGKPVSMICQKCNIKLQKRIHGSRLY